MPGPHAAPSRPAARTHTRHEWGHSHWGLRTSLRSSPAQGALLLGCRMTGTSGARGRHHERQHSPCRPSPPEPPPRAQHHRPAGRRLRPIQPAGGAPGTSSRSARLEGRSWPARVLPRAPGTSPGAMASTGCALQSGGLRACAWRHGRMSARVGQTCAGGPVATEGPIQRGERATGEVCEVLQLALGRAALTA